VLIQQALELPMPSALVLDELSAVSGRDLATIATSATSSGEALLERSGLVRLDQASQCHFGAQLGRPFNQGAITVLQLRWWNDKARSLTPGFIGEVQVRPLSNQRTELVIVGEYHPRAHLYELVDLGFLQRMASAVAAEFLRELRGRILDALKVTAS
jgi:hypothetical protein